MAGLFAFLMTSHWSPGHRRSTGGPNRDQVTGTPLIIRKRPADDDDDDDYWGKMARYEDEAYNEMDE